MTVEVMDGEKRYKWCERHKEGEMKDRKGSNWLEVHLSDSCKDSMIYKQFSSIIACFFVHLSCKQSFCHVSCVASLFVRGGV